MNPFGWHWMTRAFLSLGFVIPAWLSINFFKTTYQIAGEVTMIWYFLGVAIGTAGFIHVLTPNVSIIPPLTAIVQISIVGVVFGSGANALLFSAIADAPNQAVPQAIQGSSSVFVFLLSLWLAGVMPQYFKSDHLDIYQFVGVAFVVIGIAIVAIRR